MFVCSHGYVFDTISDIHLGHGFMSVFSHNIVRSNPMYSPSLLDKSASEQKALVHSFGLKILHVHQNIRPPWAVASSTCGSLREI